MTKYMPIADALLSYIVPDTISYTLPPGVKNKQAPDQIAIDGFGVMQMQRTRESIYDAKTLHCVDQATRKPLFATARVVEPSDYSSLPGKLQHGPAIAMGAGVGTGGTPLFTPGQAAWLGMMVFCCIVNAVSVLTGVLWSLPFLAASIGAAYIAYKKASYHIPPVPPTEALTVPHSPSKEFMRAA